MYRLEYSTYGLYVQAVLRVYRQQSVSSGSEVEPLPINVNKLKQNHMTNRILAVRCC